MFGCNFYVAILSSRANFNSKTRKMVTKTDVAQHLSNSIDWNRFFSVVDAIGSTLNKPKDRFDKSDIFELALEVYSNNAVNYVNEEGRDHYIPELQTYVEMKYDESALYSRTKKQPQTTVTLTLVNTMGNRNTLELPYGYADFVLAVGLHGCAVVDKASIIRNLCKTNDQLKSRVPFSEFAIVRAPNQISRFLVTIQKTYKDEKTKLQREFLQSIVPKR